MVGIELKRLALRPLRALTNERDQRKNSRFKFKGR